MVENDPNGDEIVRLTAAERALVRAVERAEVYHPDLLEIGDISVRSGVIRAIFLGLKIPVEEQSEPRQVNMLPFGLRIGACDKLDPATHDWDALPRLKITNSLDLRGFADRDGSALPPLELTCCDFEEAIDLSGAKLGQTSFGYSRFRHIVARGSHFVGDLVLNGCGPRHNSIKTKYTLLEKDQSKFFPFCSSPFILENSGAFRPNENQIGKSLRKDAVLEQCTVNLGSTAIDGCLYIEDARFCVAGNEPGERRNDYGGAIRGADAKNNKKGGHLTRGRALDLEGIKVRDSIYIKHSVLVGKLSVVNAEIGDNLVISASQIFTGIMGRAIDLRLATIGGALNIVSPGRENEDADQLHSNFVVGQISGIGLLVSEIWIAGGIFVGRRNSKLSGSAIDLSKATVSRSITIGEYYEQPPRRDTYVRGTIKLTAVNIAKNLEIHKVRHWHFKKIINLADHKMFYGAFGLDDGLKPKLRLLAHGIKVDRRVYISNTQFRSLRANDDPEDRNGAIDFWKSTIGTGFRIGRNCSAAGSILLNNSNVGREVIIRSCKVSASSRSTKGNDDYSGDPDRQRTIPIAIDLAESVIEGHVKIGAALDAQNLPDGHDQNPSGDLQSPLKDPRTVKRQQEIALEERRCKLIGGISLEDAEVRGSLKFFDLSFCLAKFRINGPSNLIKNTEIPQINELELQRVAINLRDTKCNSELEVRNLNWKIAAGAHEIVSPGNPSPLKRFAKWWGQLNRKWKQGHNYELILRRHFAVVDMRGMKCGAISDNFGLAWNFRIGIRLRIAGFACQQVEPTSRSSVRAHGGEQIARADVAHVRRLRWLAYQNRMQHLCENTERCNFLHSPPGFWERGLTSNHHAFVPQTYDAFAVAYTKMGETGTGQHIFVERKDIENTLKFKRFSYRIWIHRKLRAILAFISTLALFGLALSDVVDGIVAPFPYLASPATFKFVFFMLGMFSSAYLLWPFIIAAIFILFKLCFNYGFSPTRAIATFAAFVIAGAIIFHFGRTDGLSRSPDWEALTAGPNGLDPSIAFVLDVEYEPDPPQKEAVGNQETEQGNDAGGTRIIGKAVYAQPSPCNLKVSSLLYSADMFLPLIDLGQFKRCTVREAPSSKENDLIIEQFKLRKDKPWWWLGGNKPLWWVGGDDPYFLWRLFRGVYVLLGWIVTSLVILTITGVLRRDLER